MKGLGGNFDHFVKWVKGEEGMAFHRVLRVYGIGGHHSLMAKSVNVNPSDKNIWQH